MSKRVKYLGIYLDTGLTSNYHVEEKIRKAIRAINAGEYVDSVGNLSEVSILDVHDDS